MNEFSKLMFLRLATHRACVWSTIINEKSREQLLPRTVVTVYKLHFMCSECFGGVLLVRTLPAYLVMLDTPSTNVLCLLFLSLFICATIQDCHAVCGKRV